MSNFAETYSYKLSINMFLQASCTFTSLHLSIDIPVKKSARILLHCLTLSE
jgi:hypothetical protein